MIVLRNCRVSFCAIAAALLSIFATELQAQSVNAQGPQGNQRRIVVGPNIQVSKAFSNVMHGEVHLAVDPKNPNNLIAGSMVFSEEMVTTTVVEYASRDGGKTWSRTLNLDDGLAGSDPAVAFGPDGTGYVLRIAGTGPPAFKHYTYIHRSKDGGNTWLPPTIIPMLDRHYVAVDDTGGKYHGRIYIPGNTGSLQGVDGERTSATLSIVSSTDSGATFERPTRLAVPRSTLITAPSVVLSDGTLVVPLADFPEEGSDLSKPNGSHKVITSKDGGETFTRAVEISPSTFGYFNVSDPHHFTFAADRSGGPFNDRLYAAWTNAYPGGADIMLSYSSDKGMTWSTPTTVNDDRAPLDPASLSIHFRPALAVSRDGVVGVMWYKRHDQAHDLDRSTHFAASMDGGETFLPSVEVSDAPSSSARKNKVIAAFGLGRGLAPNLSSGSIRVELGIDKIYLCGGDTAGLAADANGLFQLLWVDNRTGVSQVWSAPVTVRGKPIRNGSADLSELDNISDEVKIVFSAPDYDHSTGMLYMDAHIRNVSKQLIRGPVKVRVTSIKSTAGGVLKIISTDNELDGTGAVWDFSPLLVDDKLRPGEKTKLKRLEFSLTNLAPLDQIVRLRKGPNNNSLVQLQVRVFGKYEKHEVIRPAEPTSRPEKSSEATSKTDRRDFR